MLFDACPPVGADPQDDRTEVRGTGNITISSGSATLTNSAELYMRAKAAGSPSPGFENIEFTGYARYVQDGDVKPASGFNMIAPTNYSAIEVSALPHCLFRHLCS